MFEVKMSPLDSSTHRYTLFKQGQILSYQEVLELWQTSSQFCEFFSDILARDSFKEFCFETPPITLESIGREFEFVLVDSPELRFSADRYAFSEHFINAEEEIVSFANLGKDAHLIVPMPLPSTDIQLYRYLAPFIRQAPSAQVLTLWQRVGQQALGRLSEKPMWISTSGGGISWLHVRLDSRPKYYKHKPYTLNSIF